MSTKNSAKICVHSQSRLDLSLFGKVRYVSIEIQLFIFLIQDLGLDLAFSTRKGFLSTKNCTQNLVHSKSSLDLSLLGKLRDVSIEIKFFNFLIQNFGSDLAFPTKKDF